MDEPSLAFVNDVLALRPALQALTRRLAAPDCDADDLVQDIVLRAWAAWHHFISGTPLESRLFTTMCNRSNRRWRKSKQEVATGLEAIELRMVTPATQENLLWAQQAESQFLHYLSPQHWEVLLLIPVQGLSYEEAARICNCSVGTMRGRLNRARVALGGLAGGASCRASWSLWALRRAALIRLSQAASGS